MTEENDGGTIEEIVFYTKEDPMREVFGSAFSSDEKKTMEIIKSLKEKGVDIVFREGVMSYQPSPVPGKPGQMVIDLEASYSAFKHEEKHALDDEASGWLGFRNFIKRETAIRFEDDAYDIEIAIAEKYGLDEMVRRLRQLKEERRRILENERIFE